MRLQRSLRPGRLPAVPGLDVAALYQAAGDGAQAGGDFYDSSKPRPAGGLRSEMSLQGRGRGGGERFMRHTLRIAASTSAASPPLALADEMLRSEDEPSRFCSAVAVRLDVMDGKTRLVLANAGHPPPLIVRGEGASTGPTRLARYWAWLPHRSDPSWSPSLPGRCPRALHGRRDRVPVGEAPLARIGSARPCGHARAPQPPRSSRRCGRRFRPRWPRATTWPCWYSRCRRL